MTKRFWVQVFSVLGLLTFFLPSYGNAGGVTYPKFRCDPVEVKIDGKKVIVTATLFEEASSNATKSASLLLEEKSTSDSRDNFTTIANGEADRSNYKQRVFQALGLDERVSLKIDLTVPNRYGKPVHNNATLEVQFQSSADGITWKVEFSTDLICVGIPQEESVGAHN